MHSINYCKILVITYFVKNVVQANNYNVKENSLTLEITCLWLLYRCAAHTTPYALGLVHKLRNADWVGGQQKRYYCCIV